MLGKKKIVELRNVTIFNEENEIFRNLSFELIEAEFCYIVGKSGSGKSTLLKTLYGEIPVQEGQAFVLGTDLVKLRRKDVPFLRRKIGMVFQDFNLFMKWSVRENLDFVLRATDWKESADREMRITEVLQRVGLSHKLESSAYALSGGEQQRLSLARAIINHPKLLIADEPTGNLDPETSDQILYLIADLATQNKMGVLFATHDQRILDKFPARTFRCQAGNLVEMG